MTLEQNLEQAEAHTAALAALLAQMKQILTAQTHAPEEDGK